MNISNSKFIVDIIMFFDFLAVAFSGFVLWFILPRGSGKLSQNFIFLREDWIFIHDWSSVFLIILLLIHLFLNFNWIKFMIFKNFSVEKK